MRTVRDTLKNASAEIARVTHLGLGPPVPVWTSGDELSPSGTIFRNNFGIIPVGFHFRQIFFKSLAPGLGWPSPVSTASFRLPFHGSMCYPIS